ncbi:MAG: DJ-1 family glyoxalase III [Candidatus Enteromonas sp.]
MDNEIIYGLMLLADGFEQTEALATLDTLRRNHNLKVDLISIHPTLNVTSSSGLTVIADGDLSSVDPSKYAFLILPGGKVGVENLDASKGVHALIQYFHQEGKLLCAICAAPSIYGGLGLLDGVHYTCFPGFEKGEGLWMDEGVVREGNFVTARSMAYSIPFAEEIVRALLGEEGIDAIKGGMYGLR